MHFRHDQYALLEVLEILVITLYFAFFVVKFFLHYFL